MRKMKIQDVAAEIEEWINENPLAEALLKKSSLKKEELKTLMIYFRSEDISFGDIASEFDINRSGIWKRWKKGYEKIIRSFYTLELAVYGGILDPEATKLLTKDLQDYLRLAYERGDIEAIRERLERRMTEMEKRGIA